MQSIIIKKKDFQDFTSIPSGWSLIALKRDDEVLHLGYAGNVKRRINYLLQMADEDGSVGELMDACTQMQVWQYESALDTLVAYKVGLQNLNPSLQSNFRPWKDYAYLALNSQVFPFLKIAEDTNDDWLYVGPFRDRFFLVDVMDTVARILRLPSCETTDWPCEKLDEGLCAGYCRSLDAAHEEEEYSLAKLDSLLKESFMRAENGILELLLGERNRYFDDLEFERADLLDDQTELLEKYRDWLIFLYSARHLSWEEDGLQVEDGRLRRVRFEGNDYLFAKDSTVYRPNEALALNLDSVDESRILYEYYQKKNKV
ncbi:MAG: hypothetical protein GX294_05020 [Candidatus Cloacimonetes bacterium]|nr:hypothetical protein [Candidatus Cloacimonadota bacterium]